jgi:hypothetical protein
VLSGNRNFEGRINPDVKMNYLASVSSNPECQVHYEQWLKWLEISGRDRDEAAWTAW